MAARTGAPSAATRAEGSVCNTALMEVGASFGYCEPRDASDFTPPDCSTVGASCAAGDATGECVSLPPQGSLCIVPCAP